MDKEEKKVEFDLYCKTCRYFQDEDHEGLCNTCLARPININSTKPVKWRKRR